MRVEHYKGGIYEIICVSRNSENLEWLVTYRNCKDGQIWTRPFEMFFELIEIPNQDKPGTVLDRVPRFRVMFEYETTVIMKERNDD